MRNYEYYNKNMIRLSLLKLFVPKNLKENFIKGLLI